MADARVSVTLRLTPSVVEAVRVVCGPRGLTGFVEEALREKLAGTAEPAVLSRRETAELTRDAPQPPAKAPITADHAFRGRKDNPLRCETCGLGQVAH